MKLAASESMKMGITAFERVDTEQKNRKRFFFVCVEKV